MVSNKARRAGFVGLAVLAALVAFVMGPEVVSNNEAALSRMAVLKERPVDVGPLVNEALSVSEINADRADSAPHQQVANGWLANDLLAVLAIAQESQLEIADDNRAMLDIIAAAALVPGATDDRPAWLLVIVVLTLAWHFLTEAGSVVAVSPRSSDIGPATT